MPEEDRFARVLVAQKISKILHDDVGIVISFHEPIKIVEIVLVNMVERCLKMSIKNSIKMAYMYIR